MYVCEDYQSRKCTVDSKYLNFDSPLNLNLLDMVVETYRIGTLLHYLSFYKQFR